VSPRLCIDSIIEDLRCLLSDSYHNVFCFSPHSLHVYGTRTCPGGAETRFGAPHLPHLVSMRVSPCFTLTVFRSNASFTKRSVSSRIACFELSRLFAFLVTSTAQRIFDHQCKKTFQQHRSKPAVTVKSTLRPVMLDEQTLSFFVQLSHLVGPGKFDH
jgi:hypothetical protein